MNFSDSLGQSPAVCTEMIAVKLQCDMTPGPELVNRERGTQAF